MHPLPLALALLLSVAGVAAAETPTAESTPTPNANLSQPATPVDASTLEGRIASRLAAYEERVKELSATALAGSVEERQRIHVALQEANVALRLDILDLQLEHARAQGNDELIAKLEANREHLLAVSKNPQTALRAEKVARPTDRKPSESTKVEHPVNSRTSLNEKGGNDR